MIFEKPIAKESIKIGKAVAAFKILKAALADTKLPLADGTERKASEEEFMFMHSVQEYSAFKHCDSRNYLLVSDSGELKIPATEEPFMLGTFDLFPEINF